MKNVWVIGDSPEYIYELLSKVSEHGDKVTAFVNGDQAVAEECFEYGANEVRLLPMPTETTWEQYVSPVAKEGNEVQPELVVVSATRRGKTFAAQLAALLDLPLITESKTLEITGGKVSFTRVVYGGLAEKELEIEQSVVVSVAPGTFEKHKVDSVCAGNVSTIELPETKTTVTERKEKEASTVNLNDASVVVGVGRGFGSQEKVKLAEDLATALGGEIACSRPVSEDLQWLAEERYIGISGQVIKPNLYIAAGISGQVQHVYGVRDAKTIVAIDKNENAQIFKAADYYIVGDLNEVLPELTASVK
jgi:electron transfer flavoprotein alpha subunit